MILRAGLIGVSPGWEELLCQAGVPVLSPFPLDAPRGAFSVIVVARRLNGDELAYLREYLREGGAVFGSSRHLGGLLERSGGPVRLGYVLPGTECRLRGLSLLDVENTGVIPREANCLRTQEDVFAVFAGEIAGGLAVVTPFDPGEALEDFRAVERYFYARLERLPSERVSRVSKGELLHFVLSALEYLHTARGIPFAYLSPFPARAVNVCGMRIDTDGGSPEEMDELYKISRESGLPFTWFLDAGSHRDWLGHFAGMEGQEIGLHCFEHRIYLDATKDEENIRAGMAALTKSGLVPSAFAAPFGFWSPDLGRAIDRAGFRYSSEFAWAYDAFPHHPVSPGGRYATLQVPIHPISIGSLLKSGFTSGQMNQYFRQVVALKVARREPLLFYTHPGHRHWDVVRDVCDALLGTGGRPMTLGEYAAWWARRRSLRPVLKFEEGTVVTSFDGPSTGPEPCDVEVCIRWNEGEESRAELPGRSSGDDRQHVTPFTPPTDIARIREFDLRGEIGRQFTRLQRRFT